MITAQLLTKNNEECITRALQSIINCVDRIIVIDLGSSDSTVKICKKFDVDILFTEGRRDHIRNSFIVKNDWNLVIEPWEVLTTNINQYDFYNLKDGYYYVSIIQNKHLTKEIRLWKGNAKFINSVFERLDVETERECPLVFYSSGRNDHSDILTALESWKDREIYNPAPYYYQACMLLTLGKYDDFLRIAEHYMHLLPQSTSISSVMNRYYYATVQLIHKRNYKPALQNLNLCLCARPLMAEFWCLTGDVYYHLLKNFKFAKEFYENAIILGSHRLKNDKWPMDISKYKSYPQKMVDSCEAILNQTGCWQKNFKNQNLDG